MTFAGQVLIISGVVVLFAQGEVTLKADRPWLRVKLHHTAVLECCFESSADSVQSTWVRIYNRFTEANSIVDIRAVNVSKRVTFGDKILSDTFCGTLTLTSVQLSDAGFYKCWLNASNVDLFTHGTYLQVYKPLKKTIDLSERTKNDILMAEGILLLLCVLVPSAALLNKSKKIHVIHKKKAKKQEENIYQGLNLDDCSAAYDQITHVRRESTYQDVCSNAEDEEGIQLEKP